MSFAATLALIAGYERGAIKLRGRADTSLGARAALWGVNEIIGLTIASFARGPGDDAVRGLPLPPRHALWRHCQSPCHADRLGLGHADGHPRHPHHAARLDAEFWRQMGYGIEWMNAVGLWVASLPGAYGRVTLFGTGPLLLATAGFLVIGLLKTPLRWSGAVAVAAATIWAASAPRPDVLIAGDGRGFAVRGNDGRLAIHHTGGDSFAVREWLAADADGRDVHDQSLGQGIGCDPSRCIGKLAGGGLIAYALTPEAFEEDCTRAALVVASRGDPPANCNATVIPRALWRQRGALVLSRRGNDFVIDQRDRKISTGRGRRLRCRAKRLSRRPENPARPKSAVVRVMRRRAKRTSKRINNAPSLCLGPRWRGGERLPSDFQYRRNKPTSLPWMRTRFGGRMRTS